MRRLIYLLPVMVILSLLISAPAGPPMGTTFGPIIDHSVTVKRMPGGWGISTSRSGWGMGMSYGYTDPGTRSMVISAGGTGISRSRGYHEIHLKTVKRIVYYRMYY